MLSRAVKVGYDVLHNFGGETFHKAVIWKIEKQME
jgi:hypothetical protein